MSSDIEIEIKIKITKEKFNEMKRYFEDNGKFIKNVEQKDEYFINKFEDLVNRAKYYIKEYNNFLMRPLKRLSPNDKYEEYIRNESSIIA